MSNQPSGFLPRIRAALLGSRSHRLREELHHTNPLAWLLVSAQSIALVLVLGHSEIPLLLTGSLTIRFLVGMGLSVLLLTALAADMALFASLKRIPILARNRSNAALWEHLAYCGLVLLIEASTYAVAITVLDRDPQALLSAQPIIPNGPMFEAVVAARAVLTAWAGIQLFVVAGQLPPQLTTLLSKGKALVGGHVETQLGTLDMSKTSLADGFRLYAAMSKAPRRAPRWYNGWLRKIELHQEAEEDRQVDLVAGALERFTPDESPRLPSPDSPARQHEKVVVSLAEAAGAEPASTRVRPLRTRRTRRKPAQDWEPKVRAAWAKGNRSVERMKAATGMPRSTAANWCRQLRAEASGRQEVGA